MNNPEEMHPSDKRNLIIFIIAAFALWYVFDTYIMQPKMDEIEATRQTAQATIAAQDSDALDLNAGHMTSHAPRDRSAVITETARLAFENDKISGSIALKGARIDDLSLKNYYETLEKKKRIIMLSPAGTKNPRYVEMGWLPDTNNTLKLPEKNTVWSVEGNDKLTPESPVTLVWNNRQGLTFKRTFTLDEDYLITITQNVTNTGNKNIALFPYALIAQHGIHENEYAMRSRMVHEGLLGYVNGELIEHDYNKIKEKDSEEIKTASGWIGFVDMYWLTSLLPDQDQAKTFRFLYTEPANEQEKKKFQVDVVGQGFSIAPGETIAHNTNVFSGAKELDVLQKYEKNLGVRHFDLAVDFGLLYFLTKPIFYLLTFLGNHVGNFGIAIILLTIMIRAAVFPLANTSFKSFAKMKMVAPQMKELREKYDDKQKLQQELVKLYEREGVNPMAGCLPIAMQIPIFFALYKVLSITLEMRHTPFYGWIDDLSQPDPTSVFNLFGLIPWDPPSMLMIGGWPCLMCLAMLVQRRLHPPPQDPVQRTVQDTMPFFMTFIMAKFAAGLVIYWTFSNIFAIIQQYIIMTRMGVEVHLFGRSPEDKEMDELVKKGPKVHPELEVIEDEIEDALFGTHESKEQDDGDADKKAKITPPTKKKKSKKKK